MNSNFFNQITQMDIAGDLHLTIAKSTEGILVVSVMLKNEACGDNAKNIIPPLNLRGTAEELDNGFFQTITAPMQSASGLMADMETFMKQLEIAKMQSAKEKEKADTQRKQHEAKDKRFSDAMAKAEELEKQGRFREAWMKVPEVAEFPDKADEIRRKRTSLSDRFSAPSLFGSEQEKPESPKEALYPEHAEIQPDEEMSFEEQEYEEEEEDQEEYEY
ncbi:PRTRC system protein E [Flavobacterium defluvii]|uniref:PRTRC system protein E n=1 Tax=Flavobacterium defluvii TaxID=370979 RepID=A0A1M5TC05_9FLAO|nr:PRTRC system protein E [Flavobacterium defluvii]SHH48249.1 PRTRC system protein E [Flavobacterium defluvii]